MFHLTSNESSPDLIKSAEQGVFSAMCQLAYSYYDERTIKKDHSKAARWFEKIVNYIPDSESNYLPDNLEEQQLEAQFNLAECYFYAEKYTQAIEAYKKIITNTKHSPYKINNALYQLVKCYFRLNSDNKEVVEWLKKMTANIGEKISGMEEEIWKQYAQHHLGVHYLLENNYDEAAKWFELANAKIMLGIFYYYGYGDLKKSDKLANEYFENTLKGIMSSVGYLWLAYLEYLKYESEIKEFIKNNPSMLDFWRVDSAFDSSLKKEENIEHPLSLFSLTNEQKEKKRKEKEIAQTISSINRKITESAYSLFVTDSDYFDENYIKITDFIFPDNMLKFLTNLAVYDSSYQVILAFYYRCKNDKKKSLSILEKEAADSNIVAIYELGLQCEESKEFDQAFKYFEKIKNAYILGKNHVKDDLMNLVRSKIKDIKYKSEIEEKNKELEKLNSALEVKNQQLELETQQKESLQNRMQKLVEQFTHSLGNVIFPDTIYQVAERLKNLPECRRDTLLLHEAYHAEIIIKLQAELLRHRYGNKEPESFRNMIRKCRRNANSGDKIKSIEDILNYAVSRATARFLNQHYARLETIRNKILNQTNTELNQLKQKFEDDILLHNCLSPIEWVSQNLRPIQITQISPLWKKIFILSDSYAEALLFGYFSEILFNTLKYADHDNKEFLTLSFTETNINDNIYLLSNWSNPTTKQKLPELGTNKGLEAIAEDLKQLNGTEKAEESLLISQQANQFQVTLFFKKDLLIDESNILKIKRPVHSVE